MNKFLRKTITVGVVIVAVLCTSGCNEKKNSEESDFNFYDMANMRYAERYQMVSLTESGILYDGTDGLIHLVTIDEGEDIIMCYDPNCAHEPATAMNPDPKCMAALFYEKTQTAYYEGTVYFFVNDGAFKHKLYKMKVGGSGRELMAEELPFSYTISYGVVFYNDKMYYTARIPYADEHTSSIGYMIRLVEFDLLTNTYRFITEETSDTIMLMHLAGDYMYMRMADIGKTGQLYYKRVNVKTCEEEVIITQEANKNECCYVRGFSNDKYFYYDRNTYEIGIRSIDGEYKEIILEGAEGELFSGWECPSGNYMFYERRIAYEGEPAGHYFMNLLSGEVIDITEETEKYSIVEYDVNYDAFITRDADFNWGMLSREKVLSEAME